MKKEIDSIKEPPRGFLHTLKFLGPGLIIAADLIGSGELIATTVLGAQAGFLLLWLILLTILLKFYFGIEAGKYYVTTGDTPIEAMNKVHGPKLLNTSWVGWIILIYAIFQTFQSAGILGSAGLALSGIVPVMDERSWVVIITIVGMILFTVALYDQIEKFFGIIVGAFSIITVIALALLQGTPFAAGMNDIASGFAFKLPSEGIYVALSVFGIAGVEGAHILMYGTWSKEKGYGAYTGKKPENEKYYAEWVKRAKGWVNVMKADNYISVAITIFVTCAFYILGAAVLHSLGLVPEGLACIETISNIYTQIYGSWSYYLFMFGAFFVLYSTFCSHIAFFPRLFVDLFISMGLLKEEKRDFWNRVFVPIRTIPALLIYLFIREPVALVLFGGVLASILTPIIFYGVLHLSKNYTDSSIALSKKGRYVLDGCFVIITVITVILMYFNYFA